MEFMIYNEPASEELPPGLVPRPMTQKKLAARRLGKRTDLLRFLGRKVAAGNGLGVGNRTQALDVDAHLAAAADGDEHPVVAVRDVERHLAADQPRLAERLVRESQRGRVATDVCAEELPGRASRRDEAAAVHVEAIAACARVFVVRQQRRERRDVGGEVARPDVDLVVDRKSTRLNSSHSQISYAVFCLKKKKK